MINWIQKKRNKKGFTLIELIVVIAILGILAAIAIPRLSGTRVTAANKANAANIATLVSAAQLAVAQEGAPSTAVTWTELNSATGTAHAADKFLSTWPTVPASADTNTAPAPAFTTGDKAYTLTIAATTGDVSIDTIP